MCTSAPLSWTVPPLWSQEGVRSFLNTVHILSGQTTGQFSTSPQSILKELDLVNVRFPLSPVHFQLSFVHRRGFLDTFPSPCSDVTTERVCFRWRAHVVFHTDFIMSQINSLQFFHLLTLRVFWNCCTVALPAQSFQSAETPSIFASDRLRLSYNFLEEREWQHSHFSALTTLQNFGRTNRTNTRKRLCPGDVSRTSCENSQTRAFPAAQGERTNIFRSLQRPLVRD